jgi:hypothetical protein
MYEYQTTVFYGQTPPGLLTPPQPDFRLRDLKCAITSTTENNSIADRFSSGNGISVTIPYVVSSEGSHSYLWVAIWERYKENG